MAKTIDFIEISWRFQGKKIDFIEIMWRKKYILVELQGNIFLMKIIYFLSIIIENVA